MINFSNIVNIAFLRFPKVTKNGVLFFPAVKKQQGRVNYVVICQGNYSGVYKWTEDLVPHLKRWTNGTMECFVLPMEQTIKIKELEDINERLPLGSYLLRIIRKINEND